MIQLTKLMLLVVIPVTALADGPSVEDQVRAAVGEQPVEMKKADESVQGIPSPSYRPEKVVQVIASALNVRTSNKAILCTVPRGAELAAVGRHADGQRIQVRLNQPGCPEYGYVDSDYVTGELMVDATNLNFRSQPKKSRDSYRCSLDNGAALEVQGDRRVADGVTWIKVRMNPPKEGCPEEGYVARSYLKSTTFADLPIIASTVADCTDCNRKGRAPGTQDGAVSGLQDLSDDVGEKIDEDISDTYRDQSQSAKVQRLVKEARIAAAACRSIAPHVCKRLTGSRAYCGKRCGPSRSKGWCKAGVREAFEKSFGYTLPGGSALAAQSTLDRKMTRLKGVSCKDAPIGAVCLYTASYHNYGHIEIKAGKSEYCSDFCAARPTTRNHTLIGVYLP